jgi:hypothetical protein
VHGQVFNEVINEDELFVCIHSVYLRYVEQSRNLQDGISYSSISLQVSHFADDFSQ